jgi:hypothetical protein
VLASEPVDDGELLRVQNRAKYIVAAERAAIRATDLLVERKDLDHSRLSRFFAIPRGQAWYAVFGTLTQEGNFLPAYAYRAPIEYPHEMEELPVSELPGDLSAIARAVNAAVEASVQQHGRRQVNPVPIEENGQLTVYVMQGFRDPKLYLLGGDHRFRFSEDGRTLLEATPLHKGIIPVDLRETEDGKKLQASVHSHILFPGPLETELATLMLYPEMGDLYIVSPESDVVYSLHPDGSIRVASRSRDMVIKQMLPDGRIEMEEKGEGKE